jgi:hypothetical protein
MKRFYLSLKRNQHVADITNRCLRHPRSKRFSMTSFTEEAKACVLPRKWLMSSALRALDIPLSFTPEMFYHVK